MKKSFVLHLDSLDILQELTTEQKGELFQAMFDFQSGNDTNLSGLMKAIFVPFKNQFERDNVKYMATCEKNAGNGSKGGRPKKTETNPKNPMGYLETHNNPQKADSDSDSDSDSKNDNDKEEIIIGGDPPKINLSLNPKIKSKDDKISERVDREKEFYQTLVYYLDTYGAKMVREFYDHWSEPNKSGTKMKFEMETTWDVSKRLVRWQNNSDLWGKSKVKKEESVNVITGPIPKKL